MMSGNRIHSRLTKETETMIHLFFLSLDYSLSAFVVLSPKQRNNVFIIYITFTNTIQRIIYITNKSK